MNFAYTYCHKRTFVAFSILIKLLAGTSTVSGQIRPFYGGGMAYNAPLSGIAPEIRAEIPLTYRLSVLPQLTYFPNFNKVHEIVGGANLQYAFFSTPNAKKKQASNLTKFRSYTFLGLKYNRWFNRDSLTVSALKKNNFIPELGAGFSFGSIGYRTFSELSYNGFVNELTLKVGIMVSPFGMKWNKQNNCPKF